MVTITVYANGLDVRFGRTSLWYDDWRALITTQWRDDVTLKIRSRSDQVFLPRS